MILAAVANNRHMCIRALSMSNTNNGFFPAYIEMPAGRIFYFVHLDCVHFLRILTPERILEWFLVYSHQFTNFTKLTHVYCLLLVNGNHFIIPRKKS